jgi:hypothetical protein
MHEAVMEVEENTQGATVFGRFRDVKNAVRTWISVCEDANAHFDAYSVWETDSTLITYWTVTCGGYGIVYRLSFGMSAPFGRVRFASAFTLRIDIKGFGLHSPPFRYHI